MGKQHASGIADITVASISSMISGDGNRLLKFEPSKFKLVLVDEAHHIVASSFMRVLDYFGLVREISRSKSPILVGVSATFSRFDGLRLSDAIDHIVYHKDYIDMIEDKWLSDVVFTTVQSKADISKVKKSSTGDFQIADLGRAVNTPENNDVAVRAWMTRATNRKSTLVFCVDLAHVRDMTSMFRSRGILAESVTGDTPKHLRSETLDAFREGQFPVLVNCGVFTEGTDIPNIDCVLLARPTKSRNLLVQMIGRGMRLHPGKTNCHVIDMVASLEVGIVTTPTLFGLDPASMVDEANAAEMHSIREQELRDKAQDENTPSINETSIDDWRGGPRKIVFTDYDSVQDLIDDTSGERHIRGISSLAWVMIGENRYILTNREGSYLTIEGSSSDEYLFEVTYTQKAEDTSTSKSPFWKPRQIAKSSTFKDAIHAADTFAAEKFPYIFINHSQSWRKSPATEGQLAFLNKSRPMDAQLTPETVTKGTAADMITKIKFGVKGWFQKLEASKRRREREASKLRQLDEIRQRETISVGPTNP